MTEPERIDDATVGAVLDALVNVADPGDADFADLVASAGREIKRRFEEDPGDLPGTLLMKFFLDGNKAIQAKQIPDTTDVEPDPDVLDLVQSQGLPTERKRELLEREAVRARDRLADIDAALEALNE